MKHIKIIEQNLEVSSICEEVVVTNSINWKRTHDLFKSGKIHCEVRRAAFEKDIFLVSGPYKIGKPEEEHSYEEWDRLGQIYDSPLVEFRKTELFQDYPLLLERLSSKFPCLKTQLVRIIITKLFPGDKVQKHYDFGRKYQKNRFHFSIQGTYKYYVADEEVTITPGTLFWFDNKQLHWAENIGDDDRISVIFDIDPNHCKDLNLPLNHYRYVDNVETGGIYFSKNIDGNQNLYLHEKQIVLDINS